jgi:hypothetical protein
MLHRADLALSAAQRAGRDRVVRADALQPSDLAATVVAPVAGA